MKKFRIVLLVAGIISAGGCAQIAQVDDKSVDIGGAYTVDPQIVWSEFRGSSTLSNGRVWTVDGLLLQRLDLFGGIDDGETLYHRRSEDEDSLPYFRDDMRANEVQEFVIDVLTQFGYVEIDATNLRPWDIDGQRGFRFDLVMATESGLEMQGLAAGAIVKDELSLILYVGTKLHYFEVRRNAVEAIITSMTFKGSGV